MRVLLTAVLAMSLGGGAAAAQSATSVYTPTSGNTCRTLEAAPDEAGYLLQRCRGPNGWALNVAHLDLRNDVTVIAPGGRELPMRFGEVITVGFSVLGERVEWRVRGGRSGRPYALIARLEVAEGAESQEDVSYLLVADLAQGCLVARVAPGPRQNERARQAADRPGACLPLLDETSG